jgi:hypothetical protein
MRNEHLEFVAGGVHLTCDRSFQRYRGALIGYSGGAIAAEWAAELASGYAPILSVLNQYPGLTWASIAKPEYQTPEQIPELVEALNDTIMGTGGTPSAPLQIRQGAGGESEGTPGNKPGIGPGDGIMMSGV